MITNGKTEARDEVFTFLRAAVHNAGYADNEIIWQDAVEDADVDATLVLVHMQHLLGRQSGLGAGDGCIRYEQTGRISIEVRAQVKKQGLTKCDAASTIIENALRGGSTPNGVWFRGVVGREVPPKDGNARTEVTAEFTYQEMTNVM